jgi:preprotein translocase subunit SecG
MIVAVGDTSLMYKPMIVGMMILVVVVVVVVMMKHGGGGGDRTIPAVVGTTTANATISSGC